MIPIVLEGALRLRAGVLSPLAERRLTLALTLPNPEYRAHLTFAGKVDAELPTRLRFYQRRGNDLCLPRGATALLRSVVRASGEEVRWIDRRVSFEPRSLPLRLELRPYQREAVTALVEKQQGFAVVPCGGGKTVIGVAALCATGQPGLVVVHTRELLDQWREAFRRLTGVEPGVVAGGEIAPRHFTVATVQGLSKLEPALLTTLGRDFGAVVVDELHHVPAETFQRILPALPAKYRFGLTATPFRADGLTPMLEWSLGPRCFRVGHEALVAAGHLMTPKVEPVATGIHLHADGHRALLAGLVEHPERNAQIVELVQREVLAGHSVLVLSARIEHCRALAAQLRRLDVEAVAVTGALADSARAEALTRFREGALPVVCATSLADEGLDIARLSRLVLATPSRAHGRTLQRLGRLMRPHPGKRQPVLYDLVDADPLSESQFRARQRTYRQVLGTSALSPGDEAHS